MNVALSQSIDQSAEGPSLAPSTHGEHTLAGQKATFHPLSYNQLSMWYLYQVAPESDAYNIWFTARICSPVDVAALQRTFQTLIDRHAILRTTYTTHQGEPVQQIHDEQAVDFAQIDASAWDGDELKQQVELVARQPSDLEDGPVMRVRLFTRTATDHVLLINNHHIAADLSTYVLLLEELGQLYPAAINGAHLAQQLPASQQYLDYVHWQRTMLAGESGDQLREYWQQQLVSELPMLDLPTDRPLPPIQRYVGASQTVQLSQTLVRQLRALAAAEGASLFTTLLAAFQVLLHRYTHQEEILVGVATNARNRGQFNTIAGNLANPVIVHSHTTGNPSFRIFLRQVRQTAQESLQHRHYPFLLLVEERQPNRDPSRPPIFQAMFNMLTDRFHKGWAAFWLPEDKPTHTDLGGLVLEPFFMPRPSRTDFLVLDLWETDETLSGFLKYNTDLFDPPTIQRMEGHFQTLLAGIVANPDQPVAELPLVTASEQRQLLVDWNDTTAPYPQDQCFHHLFEAQVARTPDAIAVVFANDKVTASMDEAITLSPCHPVTPSSLTYRELNRRANQLAHYLQALGVGPDSLVGLCVERSPEMIIGMLGILKAGGAYLPLDPTYPPERLAFMLADAQPRVLLTQHHLLNALPLSITAATPCQIVCLDSDWHRIAAESNENPVSAVNPDHLAYVIYTSGSTGRPKGVLVPHRGLCNVLTAQIRTFHIRPQERILQFFSLSFDAAISEISLALGAGATLCLLPREQLLPGADFVRLLRELGINLVIITPSALAALPTALLPDLHTLCVAGEACPAELVERWGKGRRFFNLYGPTEATIWATVAECQADGQPPPIGRPIINTQLYILDRRGQPVPVGVSGELYIGGVGVARGYLNRPELTAKKFVANPFGAGCLYKTGDLVRYRPAPEGPPNIEFLGRLDDQVKLRGFRIELGEIEATLNQHPAVEQSVVISRRDDASEPRLVAYLVARAEADTTAERTADSLRTLLKQRLPAYMVPAAFVWLEQFPLTPNGKIDRKALPAPAPQPFVPLATAMLPQTEAEQRIAAIWRELLHLAQVGIHGNFFDLGGHSLLLVQAQSRLQAAFGRDLSMVELFTYPTIHTLARYLSQDQAPPADPPLSQRWVDGHRTRRTGLRQQRTTWREHQAKHIQEGALQ